MTATTRENTKRARKIKSTSHEVHTTQRTPLPARYSNSKTDPCIGPHERVFLNRLSGVYTISLVTVLHRQHWNTHVTCNESQHVLRIYPNIDNKLPSTLKICLWSRHCHYDPPPQSYPPHKHRKSKFEWFSLSTVTTVLASCVRIIVLYSEGLGLNPPCQFFVPFPNTPTIF